MLHQKARERKREKLQPTSARDAQNKWKYYLFVAVVGDGERVGEMGIHHKIIQREFLNKKKK